AMLPFTAYAMEDDGLGVLQDNIELDVPAGEEPINEEPVNENTPVPSSQDESPSVTNVEVDTVNQEPVADDVVDEQPQAVVEDDVATVAVPQVEREPDALDEVISNMTLDEKISQLIIVAARTWEGQNLTDLSAAEGLADALQNHQYGGVLLYGPNVQTAEQTAQLVADLQNNGMSATISEGSARIPYFMAVDEEGGVVLRLTMGTRMTGSMAVGATGANAVENAQKTGRVLGVECAALGFNVNFAPSIDVNSNPANPVIGTRSFSDDPELVGELGVAFAEGNATTNVIATFKHFPGHGDTATDTHIGTATVYKTIDQLNACELVPFRLVADSADMIMTAHVTLPLYDDEVEFADGTKGYYPSTMSHKVISELLRGELGYDGVVITDALEMGAVAGGKLVPGAAGSVEYCVNVAEKVINAGCDILLLPRDLNGADAAAFYDGYIAGIAAKVNAGAISISRIDESLRRVLELKQRFDIFDPAATEVPTFVPNPDAATVVGSAGHHAVEKEIAQQVVTMVKNADLTLPISGHQGNVVLLGRLAGDNKTLAYTVRDLQSQGIIAEDAYVRNLVTGTTSGSEDSAMHITIDYYCGTDAQGNTISHYTEDLVAAIAKATTVICLTASFGSGPLAETSPLYQSVARALAQTHAAGGKFVLMANNLPYDVARYQDADALMLGYMASGLSNVDPATDGAYNANVIAAIESIFDNVAPTGILPVMIPAIEVNENGSITYTSDTLYERGFGLTYQYAFVQGDGSTYQKQSESGLAFVNNARFDKLVRVLVDGIELAAGQYEAAWGLTNISLMRDFLETLASGNHVLAAIYNYGKGEFTLNANFFVTGDKGNEPQQDDSTSSTTDATSAKTSVARLAKTGDTRQPWVLCLSAALVILGAGLFMRSRQA
ncbi:MAG: hypothetical protein IKG11_04635, partial [Atopobiaceae bacterium]|nr:hypothetical protein [Atopobiaceae bacterium]